MKIRAYAKINLALDVVSEREDGYHELNMIMAPIGLHDLIIINPSKEPGIHITTNTYRVPTDERNIMYKVADALIKKYDIQSGVNIHCYKHIPSQAGMGGGSADGAAIFRAMNGLFHLHMSYQDMCEMGKEIGADIPFCVWNRIAVVGGIGENLRFIDRSQFNCHLLVVKPKKGVSTKRCFDVLKLDEAVHPDIKKMTNAIKHNDYQGVVDCLGNTLEAPSLNMVKEIEDIKKEMIEFGFDGALMSGSGSSVFGMTQNEELIDQVLPYFKKKYPFAVKTYIHYPEKRKKV